MITSTKYGKTMRFVTGVKVLKGGRLWFSDSSTDNLRPFILSRQPIQVSRDFKFEVPENYLTRFKFKA